MQHDAVIWKIISPSAGGFCSFRRRIGNAPVRFCKNTYNVLGVCNELSCPLANSRYATIREKKGECYLMIKTIERAHTPSKHWEKIKLSTDYMTALKQIDEHLLWWPSWYIHKCKLRLTKIHQFVLRSRKLALAIQPKLVRIWKPYERQQRNRERKAEIAAKISNVVKSELLERLHEGVYEGIYNFPQATFQDVMKEKGVESEEEQQSEEDEPQKQIKEKEFIGVIESDDEDLEYETEDDIEDAQIQKEYEYEYEFENEAVVPQMERNVTRSNNTNNYNNKRSYNKQGNKRKTGTTNNNNRNNYNNKQNSNYKRNHNRGNVLGKRKTVRWKDQQGNNGNRKRQKMSIGYDD